ncbi:YvrJ family protein [bacterium]|nr:YvrJ family protein [bacterium]
MGFKEIVEAVGQVGFPIVVATYLMIFLTRTFDKLLERFDRIEQKIEELRKEMKKK